MAHWTGRNARGRAKKAVKGFRSSRRSGYGEVRSKVDCGARKRMRLLFPATVAVSLSCDQREGLEAASERNEKKTHTKQVSKKATLRSITLSQRHGERNFRANT